MLCFAFFQNDYVYTAVSLLLVHYNDHVTKFAFEAYAGINNTKITAYNVAEDAQSRLDKLTGEHFLDESPELEK